jgi:phospholipid/cholesterol/gamma-HCH transport system substrate-binding protein
MRRRRLKLDPEQLMLFTGAGVVLALLLLGMGASRNWWSRKVQLNFRTYSAAGLNPGMQVKISGYRVGSVERITLLNDAQVLVTLKVDESRQAMIGRRSRASLTQDGLLGRPYVALTPDLTNLGQSTRVRDGDTLIYEPSPDLASLIKEVAASRLPLQQILTHAAGLMQKRLPTTLNQLDRTLLSGERLADGLQTELAGSSGLPQTLMGRIDSATGNLEQTLGSLKATLVEVESLARSSNSLLQGIRRSWLLQLLEPVDKPPLNPAQPAPGPAAPPAGRCPGAAPCRD